MTPNSDHPKSAHGDPDSAGPQTGADADAPDPADADNTAEHAAEHIVEHTAATTTVQATVDECFAVGVDIARYPEWVDNLAAVTIEQTDDDGRPSVVRFEAEGLGRRSSYSLGYDFTGAPNQMAWSLVEGDLAREIEGRYVFADVTEDGGEPATEVQYELTIDLAVPLPGFVKRRAEDKIVSSALAAFKRRVEAQLAG